MSGNTIGRLFSVTTYGESHGPALGAIVDGCPPGMELCEADIQVDLDRRRPGRSRHTSQRKEADQVRILSGVFEGVTTGTPIGLDDREHRSAAPRLLGHQGQVSSRARRLQLPAEVRHPRLPRRGTRLRPGDGHAGGRRSDCPQVLKRAGGHHDFWLRGATRADPARVPEPRDHRRQPVLLRATPAG